jgi:hypothetical protein
MNTVRNNKGSFSITAYQGDAKTLLAFDLDLTGAKNLAGFTIQCTPAGGTPYFLHNQLQFKSPADHAQDPEEPANSSINAPIHKFRWVHVPGSVHQGRCCLKVRPFCCEITYYDVKCKRQK